MWWHAFTQASLNTTRLPQLPVVVTSGFRHVGLSLQKCCGFSLESFTIHACQELRTHSCHELMLA